MGKKSRGKDRNYITAAEWQTEWGGYRDKSRLPFKRMPFHCCGIAFTPFEDPCCTADGTVFDIVNLVPYVQKYKRHPVSGEPLQVKDIFKLTFHKNADGEYHCPVLNKVFTEHTHIVAIKTTGNVYCYEAVEELNIKPRNWKDLLTDEPFTRKDIIHLQDPHNLAARDLTNFDHVKNDLRLLDDEELARQQADPAFSIKSLSEDAKRVMNKLGTADAAQAFESGGGGRKAECARILAEAKAGVDATRGKDGGPDPRLQPPERSARDPAFKPGASTWNTDDPAQAPAHSRARREMGAAGMTVVAAGKEADKKEAPKKEVPKPYMAQAKYVTDQFHTTGAASRSLTSTAVGVVTKNERLMVRVERRPTKKAYLRLHTSLGDLNLELHCDIAPRTCENFLVLAESGYYTDTVFHRSIRNFMIQGGDPTSTGTGGESIYGPTFKDEMDSRLQHSGRGVLSMANSGPNTNGSQFFILYKSAHHLDYKHTVFGKVVGGFEVLTAMEKVPVNDEDRPLTDINITGATVFVNPYKEEEQEEARKAEEEIKKAAKEAAGPEVADFGSWYSNPAASHGTASVKSGVGKYIGAVGKPPAGAPPVSVGDAAAPLSKKQKVEKASYGNFDAW